jgi:acyl-CoA reductase-like NAD-dependent aldehyde dehydrogenase
VTAGRSLPVTGANLIAGEERRSAEASFTSVNPRSGEAGDVSFREASEEEIASATAAAADAFRVYADWSTAQRAALLRGMARSLDAAADTIIAVADWETALGEARLTQELARTTGQLRAFADVLDDGWYVEAIIDTADPEAKPIPRPDVRRMLIPLGPVAVFGASNFPLAFSVPGGDTASALAAGCPVVVKGHPSHPATSEVCARALLDACEASEAPVGLCSMVQGGATHQLKNALKSAGFTDWKDWNFYVLRHHAASWILAANRGNLFELMKILEDIFFARQNRHLMPLLPELENRRTKQVKMSGVTEMKEEPHYLGSKNRSVKAKYI